MITTELTKRLGKWIRYLREQNHLTQDALDKKAGMATNTLARLERGDHPPTTQTLEKLAKVLKLDVVDILKF